MKRYNFPIIVGILAIALLATSWFYEKKLDQDAVAAATPERQAACEQFLTVALFPDDGSARTFMEACLRGDPVLPGELEGSALEGELAAPPLTENPSTGPYVGAGCAIGGCSQQICGEAGEVEDIATTCEWREEYACYAASRCEKQVSGQCGWTETEEFNQCIADAAASSEEDNIIY